MRWTIICCLILATMLGCTGCRWPAPGQAQSRAATSEVPGNAVAQTATTAQTQAPSDGKAEGVQAAAHPHVLQRADFAKLEKLPTSKARLDLGMTYMRALVHDGEPTTMGYAGGPIDGSYHQVVVMEKMGGLVDRGDLAAARKAEPDPQLKDRLTVVLGLAGDRSVVPELKRLLIEHPDYAVRQEAATALGNLREASAEKVLRQALNDRHTYVGTGSQMGDTGPVKFYPVREQAWRGLWVIGVKLDKSVYSQPRRPGDQAELVSYLLEDREPQSCASGVVLLGALGEKGRPYLEAFVKENADNKDLAASVKAAQEILAKSPPAAK